MTLLIMLAVFTKIGLFSVGGGYAILAMIKQEVVLNYGWLTEAEFFDIVAVSQMTPGPIAINAATFIGYQKSGIAGAVVCTLGVILPSLLLMLLITLSYVKLRHKPWFNRIFYRLRPLAIGLIAAAAIMAGRDAIRDWFSVGIFAVALLLTWKWKINPFLLLIGAGIVGFFLG
ncbi:MAG: chromate transporter [Candidatus Cloacimonetes bacterium]|nr:chromate transporter [Candidatus Cloacimonadota bacterium]